MDRYLGSLERAGAIILASESFGSYQGDLIVKVSYQGQVGWLDIGYGSCSYCDSYRGFFSDKSHFHPGNEYFSPEYAEDELDKHAESCPFCKTILEDLKQFGESYLGDLQSLGTLLTHFEQQAEWDDEANEIIKFLESNK